MLLLLLRISSRRGHSGVRVELVELLLALLNATSCRWCRRAARSARSGDLAPLAHLALVLIGEGEAWYEGERMPGGRGARRAGLEPRRRSRPRRGSR